MQFVKMHGLGNDYLFVYGTPPANASVLSRMLSDRHRGPGADGMIWITPAASPAADFGMRIFNADGSEAMMCGNGIRCVGKYVYDRRLTEKTELIVETQSGPRTLILHPDPDDMSKISTVTVDMGLAAVGEPRSLPISQGVFPVIPVSVGNPHAVVFCADASQFPTDQLAEISVHRCFPDGVNAECAEIVSPTVIRMRVWERGSGMTMACGTGACAVCAAAVNQGFSPAEEPITVFLDGGTLSVTVYRDGHVVMTGGAVSVYEGFADANLMGIT
ncbi:MAG: diaminopimelate epimerase [Ruminococcaceae bacterium]|nr:diaminopimelate epimerase [Oscillospiraceae bacterium]